MKRTTYTGTHTNEISFPLGGIGTGSIGLAGNGRLIDWEIFGNPNKNSFNGHTHIAVKAEKDGRLIDARVLNGDVYKNHTGQIQPNGHGYGFGLSNSTMAGFPHFRECVFHGEYPMASIDFAEPSFPAKAKLTAFNPFIPHNEKDSSIPAAFLEVELVNDTNEALDYSVAMTLVNILGQDSRNTFFADGGIIGIKQDSTTNTRGDLTLATDAEDYSYQEYWYRGDWYDALETYWRNFTEYSALPPRHYDTPGRGDQSTICARKHLEPGEVFRVRFALTWNIPEKGGKWMNDSKVIGLVRNYYSYLFADSCESARYALKEWDRLLEATKRWHDELFASTLPEEVLDAVSATSSVLKTETCFRIGEKGDFYGWEGLAERVGSCHGTCTHVWNYAYTLPFLFPALERNIRENDYKYNQKPSGEMVFRTQIPFGEAGIGNFRACVDGQMGGIIKVWREWKLCGDTEWLKSIWPEVKKSLEYAWSKENADRWDADKDGVAEGRQHHTLDMELFGPSSWLEGFYLGALKAGAEMARALGEEENAAEWEALFEKGRAWCDQNLFNGSYYAQQVNLTDKAMLESYDEEAVRRYWNAEAGQIKYQIGEGCIIDQLLAQWHADIIGLGDLYDPDQVKIALGNMYKNNFKESMRDHYNTFRIFAMNDESGAIICDYPAGCVKPAIPIPYAQESMHGFEYSFAGLLISRGYLEEGLRVVRGVRDRYNGENRNPWNEIECGSNYARSMASFALLPILSGMKFDMTAGILGFDPKLNADDFRCVWSVGSGWGRIEVKDAGTRIGVLDGSLALKQLHLPYQTAKTVTVDGKSVGFTVRDGAIVFDGPVICEKEITVR